jgi:hypothetical protein
MASSRLLDLSYFFAKNDIMFPWLPFGPPFLATFAVAAAGAELAVFALVAGGASSSEKDSQPCSWMVTARPC